MEEDFEVSDFRSADEDPNNIIQLEGVDDSDDEETEGSTRGGLGGMPSLPNMGDKSKEVLYTWGKAPRWRTVIWGLNAEGTCNSKSCAAYNQLVWCKWGFGQGDDKAVFYYNSQEGELKCPICAKFVKPQNFGFAGTWFKVVGSYRSPEQPGVVNVDTKWKQAPSTGVTTYKYNKNNLVKWGSLNLHISVNKPVGA